MKYLLMVIVLVGLSPVIMGLAANLWRTWQGIIGHE